MSVTYQTTFRIFKNHPLGYVAIFLWVLASVIDILDMLLSLATGDLLSALLDLLVVVALICYIFTPVIAKSQRPENPIGLAKTLFIVFASTTIFFDIMYAIVSLSKGYYLTGYYWFTLAMDISLTFFTVLGVVTTLKNVQTFDSFTSPVSSYTQTGAQYSPYGQPSSPSYSTTEDIQSTTAQIHSTPISQTEPTESNFCPNCGAKNKTVAKFCTSCGASLN